MTSRQDIIGLLKDHLNGAVLLSDGQQATFDVIDYVNPAYFLEKYLQVNKVGVLFTVRRARGLSSRFLQQVPHANITDFEVGVWCLSKEPPMFGAYSALRDAGVCEVQRIFKSYPSYGSEQSLRDDDHPKGSFWIFNSTITVTKKTNT
jgi:hypothetical protein